MNTNWSEGQACEPRLPSGEKRGATDASLQRSDVPGGKPSPDVSSHAGLHAPELTQWVPLRSHVPIGSEAHRPPMKRKVEEQIPWLTLAALVGGAIAGRAVSRSLFAEPDYSFHGRTVVITGGSRGLGLVLARELAAEGARLALLARDFNELAAARDELSRDGAQVYAVPCDVRDRHDVGNAVANIARRFGPIDVLINNAGIIAVGPYENMTVADYEDAMATHYWGPLYMIQAALPHLKRAGDARIVNIASFAGRMPVPHMAPYTASKYALVGLSDALQLELAPQGISVTTVAPGPLRTGSHVNAIFKGQHEREYGWFAGGLGVPGQSTGARHAAQMIIEACRHRQTRVTIGLSTRLAMAVNSVAPSLFTRGMKVFARTLPPSPGRTGDQSHTGWDSRQSSPLPKGMSGVADREIELNNQLFAPQAPFNSEREKP